MPMTQEELMHYENLIYLPMVLAVLKQDREHFVEMSFKFARPYQEIIDNAIKAVESDYRFSKIYNSKRYYKLVKYEQNKTNTTYQCAFRGTEERLAYQHEEMRDRTEKLISVYFSKSVGVNPLP
ncbi:hypothetical protein [Planococcus beigongshangi]|uniref:hypothetical protein n=1 Tax=Planococcus beigongshangi TaxID=2782536 RepID=UPI00193C4BFF|nr:hypothetical protein [Planococcus beigongshangi]